MPPNDSVNAHMMIDHEIVSHPILWQTHMEVSSTNLLALGRQIIIKLNLGRIKVNQAATILAIWTRLCEIWWWFRLLSILYRNEEDNPPRWDVSERANIRSWRQCRAAMFPVSEIVYYYSDKESRTCPSEVWVTHIWCLNRREVLGSGSIVNDPHFRKMP